MPRKNLANMLRWLKRLRKLIQLKDNLSGKVISSWIRTYNINAAASCDLNLYLTLTGGTFECML